MIRETNRIPEGAQSVDMIESITSSKLSEDYRVDSHVDPPGEYGSESSHVYHNHRDRSNSDDVGGGGLIPPPPPPPEMLRVPPPVKYNLGRGDAERRENQRRTRRHEQQLDAYYRKYG
jgi:hypothetical protein